MNQTIVRTQGLTKQYGHHRAVSRISMHVRKGAVYGLIGRNGAGKTTFLKMLAGLASSSSGEIEIFGLRGKELANVRSRIGCLIEAPGIYGNLSAYDNLDLKCRFFGIHNKGYIEEILKIVGLSDTGKKKTKHFSLGMKQRLGIGLALVGEPDLLLLDEPINGLDPQGIVEIRDTILKLNKEKNMTIVISSHILEELSKIATDYGIIHHGELIEEITREELMERCGERIEIATGVPEQIVPILDRLGIQQYQIVDSGHVWVFEKMDRSAWLNRELIRAGADIRELKVCSEKLENYYLNLTGGAGHAEYH